MTAPFRAVLGTLDEIRAIVRALSRAPFRAARPAARGARCRRAR